MEILKEIEYIDRYLDGTLPTSEREPLKQQLKTDAVFRQTFDADTKHW